MTDAPERELIEKLLKLAHQQADGTDFHKGRRLTAEDTMYFVAARKIEALLSRVDKLEEAVDQYQNTPYRSADWLANEIMNILGTGVE